MNAKRLLKLVDLLRSLPPKRFDYACWVGEDYKGAPDLSCGTTACALGWAATIPALRRYGLTFRGKGGETKVVIRGQGRGNNSWDPLDAGARIFDISRRDSGRLFIPENDWSWRFDSAAQLYVKEPGTGHALSAKASAKQVARYIERFVQRELKKPKSERSHYEKF